ncbi:MAG: hypothetical protein PHV35_02325 [Mariniphaga sp.]|nr:hypothetical protein [Mariniphaga sp.]
MNKITLFFLLAIVVFGCGNPKKSNETAIKETDEVVYTVDELIANAEELAGTEVAVKGTVMHVCKQGGGRCFLMGSGEEINIRVEAGQKIGAFSQEQMGSDLTIRGIFKEVKTEADAHNPAREHGEEEHAHDEEADAAHQIIQTAEEKAEVVYFIEGLVVMKEE